MIDVNVLVSKVKVGTISELDNKVTIVLDKPTGLPELSKGYKRVLKITSLHEGQVIEYETTDNGDTLSCEADLFSTFTVAYEDVVIETVDDSEPTAELTEEVKQETTSNPKTGDNIVIYIAIMLVSAIGVVGTIKFIKKKD